MIKPDLNPPAQKAALQARPTDPTMNAAAASNAAAAAPNNAELMEKKRLEAQARRAAKMQELASKQQQQQAVPTAQAPRPVAAVQPPAGGTGPVSAAQLLANSAASGPGVPPVGNARPPGLRQPQPPQQPARPVTLARTHSIGHNGGQAGAPTGAQAGPRVAGALPSLNLGAGMARAAGTPLAATHAATTFAGQATSGGPTSAATADATFQSARSVKRHVEEV